MPNHHIQVANALYSVPNLYTAQAGQGTGGQEAGEDLSRHRCIKVHPGSRPEAVPPRRQRLPPSARCLRPAERRCAGRQGQGEGDAYRRLFPSGLLGGRCRGHACDRPMRSYDYATSTADGRVEAICQLRWRSMSLTSHASTAPAQVGRPRRTLRIHHDTAVKSPYLVLTNDSASALLGSGQMVVHLNPSLSHYLYAPPVHLVLRLRTTWNELSPFL